MPKLTPEEKAALKAQKKIEKKERAAEKKKQLKRDVLLRELKYSDLTYKRHEKEWRQLLIDIALPAMRDDLEFAWHNFERVIDCKDFQISLLMDEIRDAEEQYMLNNKNHVEHIDKLIDMFRERLEELSTDFHNQLNQLQQKTDEDMKGIKEESEEDENYLKTIVFMLELAAKQQEQDVRAEYYSKLEEEDTKGDQGISRLRVILEQKREDLDKNTKDFLDNYENKVKERRKAYDELKEHDDEQQKLLGAQLEKIRKGYDRIRNLRLQLRELKKIIGRRLADLEGEFNFFDRAFNLLKQKLIVDRKIDFDKLNTLTVSYNDAKHALEKLQTRGEHILHVAAVCRKLETQEEKIMPFPCNGTKDNSRVVIDYIDEYISEMELFWQRVGQADASRYAIFEEREFLKTENHILKMKLHRYCQCLTCPAPEKNVAMKSVAYVTEGVLEQKKYAMQNMLEQFGQPSKTTTVEEEKEDELQPL